MHTPRSNIVKKIVVFSSVSFLTLTGFFTGLGQRADSRISENDSDAFDGLFPFSVPNARADTPHTGGGDGGGGSDGSGGGGGGGDGGDGCGDGGGGDSGGGGGGDSSGGGGGGCGGDAGGSGNDSGDGCGDGPCSC